MRNNMQEGTTDLVPSPTVMRRVERGARRITRLLDGVAHRLYGWRANPLHQSGALAAWLLLVLTATGLYLLLFYRLGAPADSVQRLARDPWLGAWVRSLHRYATDAFVVAALLHAVRLAGQAREWGPRLRAWSTGVVLLIVGLACAWTGFVMAWDSFGARLAIEGARLFDALPLLSEPVGRIFAGAQPPPGAFFFINLFVHIALPLGMGIILWVHVSKVARPVLIPPRALRWQVTGVLTAVAIAWPAALGPAAVPLALHAATPLNVATAWWLPLAEPSAPGIVWAAFFGAGTLVLLVPWLARRARTASWSPSVVDPRRCTGCDQCTQDCPWEAIAMVPRDDARQSLVARVDPTRCVSCGICAGSCAPMGVGPPGRAGRDQLAALEASLGVELRRSPTEGRVVVMCCAQTPQLARAHFIAAGVLLQETPCVGSVHTSVIERCLQRGASGVMLVGCPPRDCVGREGPKWLEARVLHDREAELQSRVDRRRVRLVTVAAGLEDEGASELATFQRELLALAPPEVEEVLDDDPFCEPAQAEVRE
jgi:coenzyme F420-reducing hydrogenase delta subunit/Pyruvate/2-oxoacid:ferredoxin oxidoreductase delta subunit